MGNSIVKTLNPLKLAIEERLKDPFLNAFILSALLWNSWIVLYIFSDLSPDTKYTAINNKLNYWSLIGPVTLSIFYNLVFPIISYYPNIWIQRLNVKKFNATELELIHTKSTQLIIEDYRTQIDTLNNTINANELEFKRAKNKLEEQLKNANESASNAYLEINKLKNTKAYNIIESLKMNSRYKDFIELSNIITQSGNRYIAKLENESDYSKFIELQLITSTPLNEPNNSRLISLTPLGLSTLALTNLF